MKRLVELIGIKTYALESDIWENEAECIKEVTDAFSEDEADPLIEALSEWIFERTGETLNTDLD